jgi:uridylate kinase
MESIAEITLKEERIVIWKRKNRNFGAGTGNPYFTTDTRSCSVVLKLMQMI